MRVRILPYKAASASAKALADALGCLRLRLTNSKFIGRDDDLIINWGNSQTGIDCGRLLNWGPDVANVSNKLAFFELNKGQPWLPQYWTNRDDIPEDAYPVVCRTILNGHSGAGIVIAHSRDDLIDAPLFVKYQRKTDEYRIHVGRNRDGEYGVIAEQRKARNKSIPDEDVNWQIRNHSNGFIFQRNGFETPPEVIDAAVEVVEASNLDFGAADIGYHEPTRRAFVFEVNTAPGLCGSTLDDYVNYFKGFIE